MPVERVCANIDCGKSFFTTPSRVADGKDKCCSKACADRCKRQGQIEVICQNPTCETVFFLRPSVAAKGKRFCSMRCRSEAGTVLRRCQNPICGKSFRISKAKIGKGGGKYGSGDFVPQAFLKLGTILE